MISNKYLFFIIFFTQFGLSITNLPNSMYIESGHDGWISILLGGVLIQLLLFVYYSLYKQFPTKCFTDYTKILTNQFIGTCINISYYVYFVYVIFIIVTKFTDFMRYWLFPKSPSWTIMSLILIAAILMAKEDLQTIGRTYFVFSFIFFLLIGFLLYRYKHVSIERILPIGENGIKKITLGSYPAFLQMLGFEVFLFLSTNFQDTKKKLFTITLVNICSTAIFAFVVLTSYLSLSNNQNNKLYNPLIYIFKSFQTKMIENVDTIFICLWSIVVCSTLVSYFYIVGQGVHARLKSIVKKRSTILNIVFLLVMCAYPIVTLEIVSVDTIYAIGEKLDFVFIILIPCLLFLINKIRGLLT